MSLDPCDHRVHVRQLFPGDKLIVRLFHADGRDHSLCQSLVHAHGRRGHTAAHIGQTAEFAEALHRAILTVEAVEYREDEVDADLRHGCLLIDDQTLFLCVRRKDRTGL